MEIYPDFKDLFALLNKHGVEYIIVGSYALAFHGSPRYTGDIDILIHSETLNAEKILNALKEFGFQSDLSISDFEKPDQVIQLGVPPVRIDFLTSITGVSWKEANEGKILGRYGDIPVFFLGKSQFFSNKRSTGRKKDLADLEALGE